MLKTGKLDSKLLEEIVFKNIKYKRPEVITRPGIGEDCAVVDFGSYECVMSTDPITAAASEIGRLAVHISCKRHRIQRDRASRNYAYRHASGRNDKRTGGGDHEAGRTDVGRSLAWKSSGAIRKSPRRSQSRSSCPPPSAEAQNGRPNRRKT